MTVIASAAAIAPSTARQGDVAGGALVDKEEDRQPEDHREHELAEVEHRFDERRSRPTGGRPSCRAGRRARVPHGGSRSTPMTRKTSSSCSVSASSLRRKRSGYAQPIASGTASARITNGLPHALVGGERERGDRRDEPGDARADDDGSGGAIHGRFRGARTQSCTPPPIVEVATSTSGHEHAWRACVLSARRPVL